MEKQETLLVGVFEHEKEARQFLDALRNDGIEKDDLGLALREGGAPTTNLVRDLIQLGLSSEEAEFYYKEMQTGKAIASVRTDDRAEEVRKRLQEAGASTFHMKGAAQAESLDTSKTSS